MYGAYGSLLFSLPALKYFLCSIIDDHFKMADNIVMDTGSG